MAGTPTQYYGFPTYADSDAVDLTAQYNTAVSNIDSELHQLSLKQSNRKRMAIFGDSWTTTAWGGWITRLEDVYGFDCTSYGVGGSTSSQIHQQVTTYLANGVNHDYFVIVGGVNDLVSGMSYNSGEIFKALTELWHAGVPVDRTIYFVNTTEMQADNPVIDLARQQSAIITLKNSSTYVNWAFANYMGMKGTWSGNSPHPDSNSQSFLGDIVAAEFSPTKYCLHPIINADAIGLYAYVTASPHIKGLVKTSAPNQTVDPDTFEGKPFEVIKYVFNGINNTDMGALNIDGNGKISSPTHRNTWQPLSI